MKDSGNRDRHYQLARRSSDRQRSCFRPNPANRNCDSPRGLHPTRHRRRRLSRHYRRDHRKQSEHVVMDRIDDLHRHQRAQPCESLFVRYGAEFDLANAQLTANRTRSKPNLTADREVLKSAFRQQLAGRGTMLARKLLRARCHSPAATRLGFSDRDRLSTRPKRSPSPSPSLILSASAWAVMAGAEQSNDQPRLGHFFGS